MFYDCSLCGKSHWHTADLRTVCVIARRDNRTFNRPRRRNLLGYDGSTQSYNTIHVYMLRKYKKTGVCEHCGQQTTTDWSNKDHQYNRRREDWQELCRMCHKGYDAQLS